MVQSYFRLALRNMRKHKFYTALNVSGLALGLTACFFMGMYIYDELTFDHFHKDYQNIYQVGFHSNFGGQEYKMAATCPPLASAMLHDIPGVEQVTRINPWPLKHLIVRYEDKSFIEEKVFYADSNFFEFFSFKLLEGDRKTVLQEPNTAVLTTAVAVKYFGSEPALGKLFSAGNDRTIFKVTGIAEPAPANTHIQYNILLSFASDKSKKLGGGWGDYDGTYTYFRKNPNTALSLIKLKLREIVKKHVAPELEDAFGQSMEQFEKQGGIFTFFPYALSSNHLYHPEIDGLAPAGDVKYIYIAAIVGLFILLIACINFMNLATARSAGRAKEVGIRKTLGSARYRLVNQFLFESFLYVLASAVITAVAVYLLLPSFNLLSGKIVKPDVLLSPPILGAFVIFFVLVVFLAGSYPAFYLTSFTPIDVLRGNLRAGKKRKGIRGALVVLQFVISIALIICTLVVHHQLRFLQQHNSGLDKNNVMVLKNTNLLKQNQPAFLNAINSTVGIENASYTQSVFPGVDQLGLFRAAGTTKDVTFPCYSADDSQLDVLKLELVHGRFFSKEHATDSTACVINETAARELGWTRPLNEKLMSDASGPGMQVIGVVKDFNFESLKVKVKPLVILPLKKQGATMLIRYNGNAKEIVNSVQRLWKQYSGNEPYEYTFLDENFDELFRSDQRLGQLFTVMSSLAVFIACLGLLGLAAFTAEQRTKEIGIRKVMGASVASVNALLCKEFMMLVGISFVIASALAWYAMKEWLSTFAYRIELEPLLFLSGGLLAAGIAWLTVSYHFIKAARSNPAQSLRCD